MAKKSAAKQQLATREFVQAYCTGMSTKHGNPEADRHALRGGLFYVIHGLWRKHKSVVMEFDLYEIAHWIDKHVDGKSEFEFQLALGPDGYQITDTDKIDPTVLEDDKWVSYIVSIVPNRTSETETDWTIGHARVVA